jgi:protein SCO1/2
MKRLTIAVIFFLAFGAARADDNGLPFILRDVGLDQHLNAQVPLDLIFLDDGGQPIRLGECVAGKPTVLVLAYYRCPMLCTQVLNGLLDCLRGIPFTLGQEFNVVTVSFDERETPQLAAAKKANYVEAYGRFGAAAGWHFLTGDRNAIGRLARTVGFRFQYDPFTDQFAHAAGIMILTPNGRLSRYFYGIGGKDRDSPYGPRDVRLALVEASEGKIGSPVDKVLLFCYHYDAAAGKYSLVAMNLVRAAGVVTVVVLGGGVLLALWRERRRRRVVSPV